MPQLTAKQLHGSRDLSFAELGALLGTRNLLAADLIQHVAIKSDDDTADGLVENGEHLFNMNTGCLLKNCGSIACIAGTMALIMGMDQHEAQDYVADHGSNGSRQRRPIARLFYPHDIDGCGWDQITREQAVKAIDNFINYGDPLWGTIDHTGTSCAGLATA